MRVAPPPRHRQDLRVPLAGDDEQRAEGRHEQEPLGRRDPRGGAAGDPPQQETRSHDREVDDRLVLEEQRVAHGDRDVRAQDAGQRRARQQDRRGQGSGEQHDRHGDGHARRQRPRGDRPEALARVLAVGVGVPDVVDQVDAAGDQAEQDERDQDREQDAGLRDRARGERHGEHEHVLRPLPGPQPLDDAADQRAGCRAADGSGRLTGDRRDGALVDREVALEAGPRHLGAPGRAGIIAPDTLRDHRRPLPPALRRPSSHLTRGDRRNAAENTPYGAAEAGGSPGRGIRRSPRVHHGPCQPSRSVRSTCRS